MLVPMMHSVGHSELSLLSTRQTSAITKTAFYSPSECQTVFNVVSTLRALGPDSHEGFGPFSKPLVKKPGTP